MSQPILAPIPYYQLIANADALDYAQQIYMYLPNQKIRRHYPRIKIDLTTLNQEEMDIAVAVAVASVEEEPDASDDTTFINDSSLRQSPDNAQVSLDLMVTDDGNVPDKKWLPCTPATEAKATQATLLSSQNLNTHNTQEPTKKSAVPVTDISSTDKAGSISEASNLDSQSSDQTLNDSTNEPLTAQNNPMSFKTLVQPQSDASKSTSSLDSDTTSSSSSLPTANENIPATSQQLAQPNHGSDADVIKDTDATKTQSKPVKKKKKDLDENDPNHKKLAEEEEALKEKEAKLEAYKQFVAEQQSKVDIDYQGIRVSIEANALPSRMYFIMNALSAIIASYGLVVNSAAVVIGAMLVAMMLGPISGVALAMIDYRIPFLRRSLMTVFAGGAMVIGIGFMVGWMHSDMTLTNEILSRTQPTSMDLMIALAGGTAGAYAMISPHLSVAVVGVAVATALVPPLAASGILFAHGEGSLGFGALLLAITNIIAIQFTNALVLWFSGFRRLMADDYKTNTFVAFFRRNAVPLILLAGIGVYLSYNLNTISKKQKFENEVNETISNYFLDKGNVLTAIQFLTRDDHQTVRAVIRGETRPSSYDAKFLENQIDERIAAEYPSYLPVNVQIRYLPVVVIDSNPTVQDDIDQTDAAILSKD